MSIEALSANAKTIFSNRNFQDIFEGNSRNRVNDSLKNLQQMNLLNLGKNPIVKDSLELLHDWMLENYRNEYVYKNAIISKLLFSDLERNPASYSTEFLIVNSKIDCIITDGKSVGFEIKTELDNSDRLKKQLSDYRKSLSFINVVTHNSLSEYYLDLLKGTEVGLYGLSDDGKLINHKLAGEDSSHLSIRAMMSSLTKKEYGAIAEQISGLRVDVPNTLFFKECLRISQSISPCEYQNLFTNKLRARKYAEKVQDEALASVRPILIQRKLSQRQLSNFTSWFYKRIS